jgi:hypothetical protein
MYIYLYIEIYINTYTYTYIYIYTITNPPPRPFSRCKVDGFVPRSEDVNFRIVRQPEKEIRLTEKDKSFLSAVSRIKNNEPVKARFWPRLEPFLSPIVFEMFQGDPSFLGSGKVPVFMQCNPGSSPKQRLFSIYFANNGNVCLQIPKDNLLPGITGWTSGIADSPQNPARIGHFRNTFSPSFKITSPWLEISTRKGVGDHLPRQSLRRGRQKSIFPQGQWF